MLPTRDEVNVLSGLGQAAAEVSPDRAAAEKAPG
jgi:hypothetical protein